MEKDYTGFELEKIAAIIESTGGNGVINEENKRIIHLYSVGDIDYETAIKTIKRNLMNNQIKEDK